MLYEVITAPLEPETPKTFEIGYKSPLCKRKLFLDMDAYYNWVENMIGPFLNIAPNGKKGGPVVTLLDWLVGTFKKRS